MSKSILTDEKIQAYDVDSAIRRALNISWWSRWFGSHIYVSDEWYYSVNINALKEWLLKDDEDKKQYVETEHDCDDFSFQLMGRLSEADSSLAVGIVWIQASTYGHALNFAVDKNRQFFFVEPQNDAVFKDKPSDWSLTLAVI